jgi:hypothetical protein
MTTTTAAGATLERPATITSTKDSRPFDLPADAATITRAADALRAKGYDVQVVADLDTARGAVLALVPDGSEVSSGASRTLEELGVTAELEGTGRYDALRPRLHAMDRATQMREMRKLGAAPDVWLNSVHALTEDGSFVVASYSGSQLGPIASGAGRVILVIGAQKIVPDLATAFRRVEKHVVPLEDARMHEAYGFGTRLQKLLVVNGEVVPGRVSVVLVEQPIGF